MPTFGECSLFLFMLLRITLPIPSTLAEGEVGMDCLRCCLKNFFSAKQWLTLAIYQERQSQVTRSVLFVDNHEHVLLRSTWCSRQKGWHARVATGSWQTCSNPGTTAASKQASFMGGPTVPPAEAPIRIRLCCAVAVMHASTRIPVFFSVCCDGVPLYAPPHRITIFLSSLISCPDCSLTQAEQDARCNDG